MHMCFYSWVNPFLPEAKLGIYIYVLFAPFELETFLSAMSQNYQKLYFILIYRL